MVVDWAERDGAWHESKWLKIVMFFWSGESKATMSKGLSLKHMVYEVEISWVVLLLLAEIFVIENEVPTLCMKVIDEVHVCYHVCG